MTAELKLPPRSEVPTGQTWDLESVFPSLADWEAGCQELIDQLPKLRAYQGRLSEDPQILLAFLELYQETSALRDRLFTYAFNKSSVDTTDQDASGRVGQARSLYADHAAATAFFDPELISIGFDTLDEWISSIPELAFLAQYIDRLKKRQPHIRSGEVEQVIAMSSDALAGPFTIYTMLNNADLTFQPAVATDGSAMDVGQSSISSLVTHTDREVRRTAWENYADGYLAYQNTYAATLTTAIKVDVLNTRTRGYTSSLHSSLESNDIPVDVFHNLITEFRKNLPTWHRYWRLRRRILGYDQLHVYDIKAPLSDENPEVTFEQAVEWICEGMAPLGEAYVDILRSGCLEKRWVDRALNKGKREGAYSSGAFGTRPFIMMSYADDIFSLSTLAHELGHSMHSYYSRRTQPYIYSRYGLFVAEVASNFNQAMVRDYLFRTQSDPAFQIALIEEAMSNYHRYFFIMPTLARFELEMHERAEKGQPLSAAVMNGLVADLFEEGYGDEVAIDRDRIGITWAQFGHMYMNFYVYQYATGISGGHALVQRILQGVPGAADGYIDFLKAGASVYPLDALRAAGVDLSDPKPVEVAFANLAEIVERLEALIG
jgi:oligoendopeptidase F